MLIYKQVQHGGIRRAALRAAGWISFAVVVMIVAPSLSQATLTCSGTPEFVQQCTEAISEIHDTTAVGEDMVDQLANSKHLHVITEDSKPFGENYPIDERAANNTDSGGLGLGSDTTTRWNPTATDILPDSQMDIEDHGVARDPLASLQHELYHAYVADTGDRSEATVPGRADLDNDGFIDDVPQREIDATRVENEYRQATGLDLRTNYGDADVPPPHQVPETGSSILMLLIGIGALWCFGVFCARRNTRPRILFALSPRIGRS